MKKQSAITMEFISLTDAEGNVLATNETPGRLKMYAWALCGEWQSEAKAGKPLSKLMHKTA